jgi:outer membrane protein assembly factor BamD (BamD/ComL family)
VQTPSAPPLTAATLPGLPPSSPQTDTTPQALVSPPPASSDAPQTEAPLSPDILLQRAKEAFDGGDAAAAIALLDRLKDYYPSGTDELYWYYGQFYEANTPSRNILLSLDYYKRLVNEYPQSSRFNDARRRIAYLERYYINIQ